jgi:hypothetical protein
MRFQHFRQFGVPNRTRLLSSLEKLLKLLVCEEGIQLDRCHARVSMLPRVAPIQTRSAPLLGQRTVINVMSSRNLDIRLGPPLG